MSFDRLLLVSVVFILTVALVISEVARFSQTTRLETQVEAATLNADAALRAIITPETLLTAEPSVYMVVNNNRHYGSAFVLDRERGVLVTAAHVAADLDFQNADAPPIRPFNPPAAVLASKRWLIRTLRFRRRATGNGQNVNSVAIGTS